MPFIQKYKCSHCVLTLSVTETRRDILSYVNKAKFMNVKTSDSWCLSVRIFVGCSNIHTEVSRQNKQIDVTCNTWKVCLWTWWIRNALGLCHYKVFYCKWNDTVVVLNDTVSVSSQINVIWFGLVKTEKIVHFK